MPYINFIHEFSAFMRYARSHKLPSSDRNLWISLFSIINDRTQGCNWPDNPIPIANIEALHYSGMSGPTMEAARGRLVDRHLIEYEKGYKNKKNPRIKLVYFTAQNGSYPQDKDVTQENYPNTGGNDRGNTGGNDRGNKGDININLTVNPNENPHTYCYDDAWRTSARARGAVAGNILRGWGGKKTEGTDVHWDIVEYLEKGMTPEKIASVLKDCAEAKYIPNYLHTEALDMGIDTEEDAPLGYL